MAADKLGASADLLSSCCTFLRACKPFAVAHCSLEMLGAYFGLKAAAAQSLMVEHDG